MAVPADDQPITLTCLLDCPAGSILIDSLHKQSKMCPWSTSKGKWEDLGRSGGQEKVLWP